MRKHPLLLFIALMTLASCLAAAPAAAQERTFLLEGRYAGSEVGDFAYLLLEEQGRTHSLVCNPVIMQALDALQPKLPVVVEFTTTVQFVEGAGEEIEFQLVNSVFVPDEYAPDFGIRLEEAQRP